MRLLLIAMSRILPGARQPPISKDCLSHSHAPWSLLRFHHQREASASHQRRVSSIDSPTSTSTTLNQPIMNNHKTTTEDVMNHRPATSHDATQPTMQPTESKTSTSRSPLSPATTTTSQSIPSSNGYGHLAIFAVALLWGSYTPSLRYMFLLEHPPSSALLNCLQACISAAVLTASVAISKRIISSGQKSESNPNTSSPSKVSRRRAPRNVVEKVMSGALNWTSSDIKLAGGELGLWMCLAFGLEIAGCELISATKTAFLNQATVLITPLLVFLSGARVRRNEWFACGLGLAGSVLVAFDGLARISASAASQVPHHENPFGYVLVLLSALFFSMATVRLGRYSSKFNSLKLATSATISLSVCSLVWVVASLMGQGAAGLTETAQVVSGIVSNPMSLAIILWLGIGPGALASFLQMSGQRTVPPSQAQVILATTPVFASGIALLTLDAAKEAMGGIAWVGAGLMILASVVASTGHRKKK